MHRTMMTQQRPMNPWLAVKTFERDGIAVLVEKQEGFRPRYSVKIGRKRDGKFAPFLPVRLEAQGKVTIHRVHETVKNLLTEAEDWIHNEAQLHENDILESKIANEMKGANHGKPKVRVTGKTQRNRDKRKSAAA